MLRLLLISRRYSNLFHESIFIVFIVYEMFNVSFVVKKCVCLWSWDYENDTVTISASLGSIEVQRPRWLLFLLCFFLLLCFFSEPSLSSRHKKRKRESRKTTSQKTNSSSPPCRLHRQQQETRPLQRENHWSHPRKQTPNCLHFAIQSQNLQDNYSKCKYKTES